MNSKESLELIGKEGIYSVPTNNGSFDVVIVIVNVKNVFGRTDLLITPKNGTGETWVKFDKVNFGG